MEEVFDKINEMNNIEMAAMLTGPHDIMAMTKSDDIKEISEVLMKDIRDIEGVKKTVTCVVIG